MPNTALSDARVRALSPRPSAYDIRDAKLRGFGVRVLPSGAKRFFIHTQHRGERFWKVLGDANTMRLEEAHACTVSTLAAIRRGEGASVRPDDTLFETVAEMVFERYARVWKPRTLEVNRSHRCSSTVGDASASWKLAKSSEGGRRRRAKDNAAAAAILAVATGVRRPTRPPLRWRYRGATFPVLTYLKSG